MLFLLGVDFDLADDRRVLIGVVVRFLLGAPLSIGLFRFFFNHFYINYGRFKMLFFWWFTWETFFLSVKTPDQTWLSVSTRPSSTTDRIWLAAVRFGMRESWTASDWGCGGAGTGCGESTISPSSLPSSVVFFVVAAGFVTVVVVVVAVSGVVGFVDVDDFVELACCFTTSSALGFVVDGDGFWLFVVGVVGVSVVGFLTDESGVVDCCGDDFTSLVDSLLDSLIDSNIKYFLEFDLFRFGL